MTMRCDFPDCDNETVRDEPGYRRLRLMLDGTALAGRDLCEQHWKLMSVPGKGQRAMDLLMSEAALKLTD